MIPSTVRVTLCFGEGVSEGMHPIYRTRVYKTMFRCIRLAVLAQLAAMRTLPCRKPTSDCREHVGSGGCCGASGVLSRQRKTGKEAGASARESEAAAQRSAEAAHRSA